MALGLASSGPLAAAHRRLANVAFVLYVIGAGVALSALLAGIVADRRYDEERLEQRLVLETQARARYFAHHLRLLSEELRRLGLRDEMNLTDDTLAPERGLLELAHANSTFFNLGVAILDATGQVLWAEPREFLAASPSFARTSWFTTLKLEPRLSVISVDPEGRHAVVYVVSPLVRSDVFTGAIVGGLDLATTRALGGPHDPSRPSAQTVLATSRGGVIYPAVPPTYASTSEWRDLFDQNSSEPIRHARLDGQPRVIALAPVGVAGFLLTTVVDRAELVKPALVRLRNRLWLMLAAVLPMGAVVVLFRRFLLGFWRSEEEAMREDRLRRLGEASNLIAHEVRNSLNGLRVGLDLVLTGKHGSQDRVVSELRAEMERLGEFAHQLMLFAKDPKPRAVSADLSDIVNTALSLTRDLASELGVEIVVTGTDQRVEVMVDPILIRIVLSNLISNSLDALSTQKLGSVKPRIDVAVEIAPQVTIVRVTDNGPGIAAEVADTLFEPFVTSKPSGVGIGLALARKIARAHGGELRLEPSTVGACFVLELKQRKS